MNKNMMRRSKIGIDKQYKEQIPYIVNSLN